MYESGTKENEHHLLGETNRDMVRTNRLLDPQAVQLRLSQATPDGRLADLVGPRPSETMRSMRTSMVKAC